MCVVKRLGEMEKEICLVTRDGDIVKAGKANIYNNAGACWQQAKEALDDIDGLDLSDIVSLHCEHPTDDTDTVYLTRHAIERMKERVGWNEATAFRMTKKIHDGGLDLTSVNMGYLSQWAKHKKSFNPHCSFILYGDFCFIFIDNILVTVERPPVRNTVLRAMRHKPNGRRLDRKGILC